MTRNLPFEESKSGVAEIIHIQSPRLFIPLEGALMHEAIRDATYVKGKIRGLESWLHPEQMPNLAVERVGWLKPITGERVSMFEEGGLLHYYCELGRVLDKVIAQCAIFEDDDLRMYAFRAPLQYRVNPDSTIKACYKWWEVE